MIVDEEFYGVVFKDGNNVIHLYRGHEPKSDWHSMEACKVIKPVKCGAFDLYHFYSLPDLSEIGHETVLPFQPELSCRDKKAAVSLLKVLKKLVAKAKKGTSE